MHCSPTGLAAPCALKQLSGSLRPSRVSGKRQPCGRGFRSQSVAAQPWGHWTFLSLSFLFSEVLVRQGDTYLLGLLGILYKAAVLN